MRRSQVRFLFQAIFSKKKVLVIGESLITRNVACRIFLLQFGDKCCTGFAIDVDNKQYVITVKHTVEGWDFSKEIQIFHEEQWKSLAFTLVGFCEDLVDVAVLCAPIRLVSDELLLADHTGIVWGQDIYFLGFPYGQKMTESSSLNNGYPLPFVKKGIVSAMSIPPAHKTRLFYLDGHNNDGFSGGPVVFKKAGTTHFAVAAVIAGYKEVLMPVFRDDQRSPFTYKDNTGIIVAWGIEGAMQLIRAKPIGFDLLPLIKR